MNLLDLHEEVVNAIQYAFECGVDPKEVLVSMQIEDAGHTYCNDREEPVELHYDNDGNASGCVILGYLQKGVRDNG